MRILGLTCVVLSLVLGGGGVAYRSQAGEPADQFGMSQAEPAREDPGHCALPEKLRLKLPRRASASPTVNLSNRGMNYGGLPQRRPSAPPASPRD